MRAQRLFGNQQITGSGRGAAATLGIRPALAPSWPASDRTPDLHVWFSISSSCSQVPSEYLLDSRVKGSHSLSAVASTMLAAAGITGNAAVAATGAAPVRISRRFGFLIMTDGLYLPITAQLRLKLPK